MAIGSSDARRRRRSCCARRPNSSPSASRVSGGSSTLKPPTSGATVRQNGCIASRGTRCQPATVSQAIPALRSRSCSTSRRPGESAASSVRPSRVASSAARGARGSGARASRTSAGGAASCSGAGAGLRLLLNPRAHSCSRASTSSGRLEQFQRIKHGMFDVVAPILVPRHDLVPDPRRCPRGLHPASR